MVLRGGTIYDGTGGPGRVADVALRGDRIAAVAPDRPGVCPRSTCPAWP